MIYIKLRSKGDSVCVCVWNTLIKSRTICKKLSLLRDEVVQFMYGKVTLKNIGDGGNINGYKQLEGKQITQVNYILIVIHEME